MQVQSVVGFWNKTRICFVYVRYRIKHLFDYQASQRYRWKFLFFSLTRKGVHPLLLTSQLMLGGKQGFPEQYGGLWWISFFSISFLTLVKKIVFRNLMDCNSRNYFSIENLSFYKVTLKRKKMLIVKIVVIKFSLMKIVFIWKQISSSEDSGSTETSENSGTFLLNYMLFRCVFVFSSKFCIYFIEFMEDLNSRHNCRNRSPGAVSKTLPKF